jgi:uncharacterized protein (DUF1015 family)
VRIAPFDALRPPDHLTERVASPPYDVVDTVEARRLAEGNPDSFLHVIRPEIDLPDGTDMYSDTVYEKAAANFADLQESGALLRQGARRFYVYRQTMGEHAQDGLVCCCHAEEYNQDIIKKHEKTRQDKEDDRTRHVMTLRAHAGPVFLTYREHGNVSELIEKAKKSKPIFDFTAPDGVQHTGWEVSEEQTQTLIEAFDAVPVAYVADGHHRSASAARAAEECRQQNKKDHTGYEEYNWFLTVLFPGDQLNILAYNRLVHDLNGHSPEEFLAKVKKHFEVDDTDPTPTPAKPGEMAMYLVDKWYDLKPLQPAPPDDPVAALDVSILQERLLAPVLGVDDPRTSKRIDFVGGIHGTQGLEERVKNGRGPVAFSLHPTTVEQLMAIADAGAIMPPKSTWFEPKLRSGLFVHTF